MTNADTLCIICCMTYQSPTDEGAGAASPLSAAKSINNNTGALRTVLVCDVVDSVHWMQVNEAAAIAQWQNFIEAVKQRVIPKLGGRLVKSLGDGLMLEFLVAPQDALKAAFAMKEIAADIRSADTTKQDNFWLRMALHHTTATVGEDDIYGHGVNLCARIATLAGPGEIVISTEMRDQLTDQLDADLEDMGECFLKHIEEPIRVYRAGPVGVQPIVMPVREYAAPLYATLAVVPFVARSMASDNQLAVGEIIADGVIGQLSRTPNLKVISRLSTSVFRNRISTGGLNAVGDIADHLGANYVLSGSYISLDKKLIVTAELTETKTNLVVWMERLEGEIYDLLQLQSELCHTIANATHLAILNTEVQAALIQPLPTLESYSLLLGGITMMHRSAIRDFDRGKEMLETVIERHKSAYVTRSWLAKWYIMRVILGHSNDPEQDTKHALNYTNLVLTQSADNALAYAVEGYALCQLTGNPKDSIERLDRSLSLDPNLPLAWLYKSIWSHMWGNGKDVVELAEKACLLSPRDPMRYFFDMVLANGYAFHFQSELAIAAAERSLKANSLHLPTLRVLLLAQVEAGKLEEAKQTLDKALKLSPDLTISKYRSMGSVDSPARQRVIKAFQVLGLRE